MESPQDTPTLARWLKPDGDRVVVGDAICEIETDKASIEIAAWADGVLHHLAQPGDAVTQHDPIARID